MLQEKTNSKSNEQLKRSNAGSNETLIWRRETDGNVRNLASKRIRIRERERGGDEELTDRLRSRDWLWSNKVAADLRKPNIVGRKNLWDSRPRKERKRFRFKPRFQPNANASLLPFAYWALDKTIIGLFNLLWKASNPISYMNVGLSWAQFFWML